MSRRVLVLDQGYGPSAYWLSLPGHVLPFEQLVTEELDELKEHPYRHVFVGEVDDSYRPRMGTVVFAADEHGNTIIWKACYDSSG